MKFTPAFFVHALTALVAAASGLLEIADRITPLEAVNPQVAHYWPLVLAAALAINSTGSAIIKLFPPSVPATQQTSILTKP